MSSASYSLSESVAQSPALIQPAIGHSLERLAVLTDRVRSLGGQISPDRLRPVTTETLKQWCEDHLAAA